MTQPVRFTSTKWETRTVPLIAEPDFEDLSEALTAEERAEEVRARDEAQETYERFRPITLEVKRVSRTTRQKWDRTFARILADDEVSRHEAKGQSGPSMSTRSKSSRLTMRMSLRQPSCAFRGLSSEMWT